MATFERYETRTKLLLNAVFSYFELSEEKIYEGLYRELAKLENDGGTATIEWDDVRVVLCGHFLHMDALEELGDEELVDFSEDPDEFFAVKGLAHQVQGISLHNRFPFLLAQFQVK